MQWWIYVVLLVLLVLVLLVLVLLYARYVKQEIRKMIFQPGYKASGERGEPIEHKGTSIQSEPTGPRITYYTINAESGDKIFLYAHGGCGLAKDRLNGTDVGFLRKYGTIIIFEYPGYGDEYTPSESSMQAAALITWNELVSRDGHKPNDIILYGEGLGCSVVAWLYSQLGERGAGSLPRGIILRSPIFSLKTHIRLSKNIIYSWMAPDEFNTLRYLKDAHKKITGLFKVLIIDVKDDTVIDNRNSRLLNDNIRAQWFVCDNGTHEAPVFSEEVTGSVGEWIRNVTQ